MCHKKTGFTLVEVMIVVAIIALLAVIAIPNLFRARIQANASAAQAHLKSIANSLENYAVIHSVYPANTSQLLGASPPYLSIDFFSGTHAGYSFTSVLADYSYTVTASPANATSGTSTFTLTTGGIISAL
ncbi:MAG TPA: prepilin-type N-terminal cleavage/methylation domain-containing protein [Candidatus Omnitrophota bacterium]|nr:prepilin-type N-terminal cleavage/methylation domain-containing protein [Candidatus Omnitrophota bacterium]HPB67546.1 prepilin-type N-terminal cleavage/methylation domain-containing protein [Candidatus Omnitrophota bacterium]HQO59053.1 prepilin-type N-terminal cleavage/methylation domain-containing protein [Candidatus Omnitrophota bacterium]